MAKKKHQPKRRSATREISLNERMNERTLWKLSFMFKMILSLFWGRFEWYWWWKKKLSHRLSPFVSRVVVIWVPSSCVVEGWCCSVFSTLSFAFTIFFLFTVFFSVFVVFNLPKRNLLLLSPVRRTIPFASGFSGKAHHYFIISLYLCKPEDNVLVQLYCCFSFYLFTFLYSKVYGTCKCLCSVALLCFLRVRIERTKPCYSQDISFRPASQPRKTHQIECMKENVNNAKDRAQKHTNTQHFYQTRDLNDFKRSVSSFSEASATPPPVYKFWVVLCVFIVSQKWWCVYSLQVHNKLVSSNIAGQIKKPPPRHNIKMGKCVWTKFAVVYYRRSEQIIFILSNIL